LFLLLTTLSYALGLHALGLHVSWTAWRLGRFTLTPLAVLVIKIGLKTLNVKTGNDCLIEYVVADPDTR
jgi:hypothetical protein